MDFKKILSFFRKKRRDKKVLVLQGGGMRGIFLVGVLQAFTDRNYFPWELIIGTSAGALTGVTYSAKQIHLARDAFMNKLLSENIINISNFFRTKKHILNLDWLVEHVLKGDEPLDIDRMKKSCPVIITAANVPELSKPFPVYFDSRKDDVFTTLKGSAALPFLYRGFVEYKEYSLIDGGIVDPVPYKYALERGYKDSEITTVLTRPKGHRKKQESFWVKSIYEWYYKNEKYKYLIDLLENRYLDYNNIMDDLEENHPEITKIYPPDDFTIDRFTRNPAKLMKGFQDGIDSAKSYFKRITTTGK